MNSEDLQVYKLLGKIHSLISTVSTFDEAIRGVSRLLVDNGIADYMVVWNTNPKSENDCYPYYWICPVDLTARVNKCDTGIVGRVCRKHETETLFSFNEEAEAGDKDILSGVDVSSVVCAPFSINDNFEGCIEFIRSSTGKPFTSDEADMCSITSLITEMYIKEASVGPADETTKEILLSAKDIRKSYINGENVLEVLKGVNLEVFDGELLCIQGESGCGKSTFLNIVGGLLSADSGNLKFMDHEMTQMSDAELTIYRRDHIGFVFQAYNLMPNLTAKQNLDLIAEIVKNPMDSMEALELVGMKERAGHYPSQLSGGQQQRVSIARALVKRPKLIFADEPTAALDFKTSIEVLEVFEKIKESGTTILMVTHNEEITRMADRVIRFRDGKTYEIIVNHKPAKANELRW